MEHLRPGRWTSGWGRVALSRGITWMTANSLVLYLSAALAQRAWAVLNTDVGQLLRRLY